MNKQELELLIAKYVTGDCTEQEEICLNEFYNSYKPNEESWNSDELGDKLNFEQQLYKDIRFNLDIKEPGTKPTKPRILNRFLKLAAILIMIVGLGFLINSISEAPAVEQKQIEWENKSTDSGEKLTLRLSDGTVIKLNSMSKLSFPASFLDDKREIVLEGEAFFEVTKDAKRPFTIRTNNITTTVLGTSFNINAYPTSGYVTVAVVAGKVKVENVLEGGTKETSNVVYLNPSRKATYDKDKNQLIESNFVNDQEIGWKQGIIYFKNARESDVIERLERWYGVDIETVNSNSRKWDLTASFDNQLLEEVLISLSYTAKFSYSINGKKVIINYLNP